MAAMRNVVLSALLLAVGDTVHTRKGTVVSVPNRLMTGKNETICVTFIGDIKDASITYNLTSSGAESSTHLISELHLTSSSEKVTCGKILLPKSYSQETIKFGVEVNAHDYKFTEIKQLSVFNGGSEFTIIHTDKPVYKPGQAVKMRIITLTAELIPVLNNRYDVWIEDPSGVRVEQWLDVTTTKGLAQLEFMLNSEPPLGKWSITCQASKIREKAFFLVQEYVLPRFEANIRAPKSIHLEDEFISGEVCASYTYGQPVKGLTTVVLSAKRLGWDGSLLELKNVRVFHEEITGCAKFTQSTIGLDLHKENEYGSRRHLEISAYVTEKGTGSVVNASAVTVNIERRKANIEILADDKYKPGLDHSGKVKVSSLDGRSLAGKLVKVVVQNELSEIQLLMQSLTDDSGEVAYTLPTPGDVIHRYTIEATLMSGNQANEWERPRTTKNVNPWYSPSGSYIQLQAPSASGRLPCGQEAHISLHYTTNESRDVDLIMQVSGLNDIVLSSLKKIKLEPQQPINWDFAGNNTNRPERTTTSATISRPSTFYIRDRMAASKNIRSSHRGYTTLSLKVTSIMAPIARLLVFYTTPDGELVADALNLEVEKCTPNTVNISFTSSVVRPGEEVGLLLTAAPKSLCAYGTVDKSVYLLGGENQMNVERLYGRLDNYMNTPQTDINKGREERSYCEKQYQKTTSEHISDDASSRLVWYRRWRTFSTMYKDASHAFQASATAVLTDLTLNTRPCSQNYPYERHHMIMSKSGPRAFTSGLRGLSVDPEFAMSTLDDRKDTTPVYKPIVEVRTYFPETWLWSIVEIGESGQVNLPVNAPHTITEWKGSATCIHETEGFGVSQVTSMKVFQPFFVSLELPYAVIRRENVSITGTVYNYHSEPLSVRLNLKKSTDFTTSFSSSTEIKCICSKDSKSHQFSLVPIKIGVVNMTVNSVSVRNADCSIECNTTSKDNSIVGFRDALVKQLLVHPEGLSRQYTNSSYVCLRTGRDSEWRNYTLALPQDLIYQSQRAYVSVIGDVMGPSLSNLDNLLQMPWGCGEQNMLGFAPNIFVMQYLEATGQANDVIRTKALGYMKSGYQRQLTYSRPDRSYSAFGTSDREGSIWLTAFVVKCFAQARQFIYIDESHLAGSIRYFGQHQADKGCFREVGKVIHKGMKGGLADTSNAQGAATLTAYIAISLLEAEHKQQEMVKKAFECLNSQPVTDPYSVALLSYAYSLYDVTAEKSIALFESLQSMAVREGDTVYWKSVAPTVINGQSNVSQVPYQKPTAADVETTAYALLALLKHDATVMHTLPVVRWLTQQRNQYGGFYSTQDTILAIQALALFAAKTYVANFNMSVTIENGQKRIPLNVNSMNSLQLQSTPLELDAKKPTSLAVLFSGNGCALVQANVRYNVALKASFRSAFETEVKACQAAGTGTKQKICGKQTLAIKTRYIGGDAASNMAIVDVNMVSGWMADKDSIRLLQSNQKLGLKRFEVNERTVSLYFEQISKQWMFFKFDVIQEQNVENTKGVAVTTYDYYNPDMRHETSYNLNAGTCSTDSCFGTNYAASLAKRN